MSEKHTHGYAVAQHTHAGNRGWEVAIGHGLDQICQDATEAKAKRIAACWNACQGIDTADLKDGSVSIINKLHDEAAKRVLAQRDELLAALKAVDGALREAWSAGTLPASVIPAHIAQQCKAAIAKVEGGA